MRFSLIPREMKFFDMFDEFAARLTQASHKFHEMVTVFDKLEIRSHELKRDEDACDASVEKILKALDRTFITPLDREDIHQLASDLDDVMDAIDGTARRSQIFHLGLAPQGAKVLTEVIQRMVGVLAEGVGRLKKGDDVMKYCIEAKKLEEEGDAIYQEALGRMFETERDALEIIKWKEIYDNLEITLDQGEDVANVLESITIKHA